MTSQQETPICRDLGPVPLTPAQCARKGDWLRLQLVKAPPVLKGAADMAQVGEFYDVCPLDTQAMLFACYGVPSGQNGEYFVVSEWALGRCFDTRPSEVEKQETLGGDSSPATEERNKPLTATATASPPETAEQLQLDLSAEEVTQLRQCEAVIARGKQTVFEVGEALRTIRDQRLYRATHRTFEAYADDHLGVSRQYAYRMIGAAGVAQDLSTIGDISLDNESQARQIGKLSVEQRQEAYAAAREEAGADESPISGKDLLKAAQTLHPPEVTPEPHAETLPPPSEALQTFLRDDGEVGLPTQAEAAQYLVTTLDAAATGANTNTENVEDEESEEASDVEDRAAELRPDARVDAQSGDTGGAALAQPVAQERTAVSSNAAAVSEEADVSTLSPPAVDTRSTPGAEGTPSLTVIDKRERRLEATEAPGKKTEEAAVTTQAQAATVNAQAATPGPAAAPSSAMVFVQLPRDEQSWLNSVGLTAAVALAQFRELRDKGTGYVLSPTAQDALTKLTDAANRGRQRPQRTESDQLEIIIFARARQDGLLTDDWED